MRRQAVVIAALAVAALGVVFWTKSGVHSAPIAPALFIDRWAPVEEAQRSGTFVVKYVPNAVMSSYEVSGDLIRREQLAAAQRGESQEDAKAATIILDARKKDGRVLGPPTLELSEPHTGPQSQIHVQNYGDLDRACSSWTDHCRTCTRGNDGALICSNIGIACQPKPVKCIGR